MPIFYSDDDRELLLRILGRVAQQQNCIIHAYCLMDNHYHLLVETIEPNISLVMHNLNGNYCQAFNNRHERVGHLFQGRYRSILVDREEYLLVVARYIVLNPVRAGLVKDPSDYLWSSYAATAGLKTPPSFLIIQGILSHFSENESLAKKLYREFVYQGIDQDLHFNLMEHVQLLSEGGQAVKEINKIQRTLNCPSLDDIFKRFSSREERNERIYAAFVEFGYMQKEIADFLGLASSTMSEIIKKEEMSRKLGA
jgi:REP-associated tyrosine transposase